MTIANVTLNNTYDEWRSRTNQLIYFVNDVESGNLARFYSNSSVLTISQNISRTSNNYININVSSSILDTSTLNVATANAVNAAHKALTTSIANTDAQVSLVYTHANNAYAKANSANVLAFETGIAANDWSNTVVAGANAWANTISSDRASASNGWANTISSDRASASNGWANTVVAGANAWANTISTTRSAASNSWSNTVVAGANAWANTISSERSAASNAYANVVSVRDRTVIQDAVNATRYIMLSNAVSGTLSTINVATALSFNPSTNTLSVPGNISVGNIVATTVIRDSKGDVREIPIDSKTAVYVLTVTDTGKTISIGSGATAYNVLVPQAVFSAGQAVTLYNNSSATMNIVSNTSVTMYLGGTATTGTRRLSQRGVATVLCVFANNFVITGIGLI